MRDTVHEAMMAALAPKFDLQNALLADVKNSIAEVSRGVSELVTLERSRQRGTRG